MAPNGKDEVIEIGSSDDDGARKRTHAPTERLNTMPRFGRFANPARQTGSARNSKATGPTETVDLTQDDNNAKKRLDKLFMKPDQPSKSRTPAKTASVDVTGDPSGSGPSTPHGATASRSQQPSSTDRTATSFVIVDSDDEGEIARASRHENVNSAIRVPRKTASVPDKDAPRKRARESHGHDLPDKRRRLEVPAIEAKSDLKERGPAHEKPEKVRTQHQGIENQSPTRKSSVGRRSRSPSTRPHSGISVNGTPRSSKTDTRATTAVLDKDPPAAERTSTQNAARVEREKAPHSDPGRSLGHKSSLSSEIRHPLSQAHQKDKAKVQDEDRGASLDLFLQARREALAKAQPNSSPASRGSAQSKATPSKTHVIRSDPGTEKAKSTQKSSFGQHRSTKDDVHSQSEGAVKRPGPRPSESDVSSSRASPATATIAVPSSAKQAGEKTKDKAKLEAELAERRRSGSVPSRTDSANPANAPQAHSSIGLAPNPADGSKGAQMSGEMAAPTLKPPAVTLPLPKTEVVDSKMPVPAAPAVPSQLTASGFPLSRQVELIVGKYLAAMREDTGYWGKMWMKRARRSKKAAVHVTSPDAASQSGAEPGKRQSVAGSIFAKMKPMQPIPHSAAAAKGAHGDGTIKIQVEIAPGTAKAAKSTQSYRPTDVATLKNEDVPGYSHYVSLGTNMLAPNNMTMNVWPYFGEDEPQGNAFDQAYYVDVAQRSRKLKRLLQAQKAEEYAKMALRDLEISWNDVLRVLLDPSPDVGEIHEVKKLLANKKVFVQEDVPQSSEKWTKLLSNLAASEPLSLSKALCFCDSFQRIAGFPLWHVARRSDIVKEDLTRQEIPPTKYEHRTCRVCLRFSCHLHGELRENEESDSDIGYESDIAVATDLVHPQNVNYRKRLPFRTPPDKDSETASVPARLGNKKQPRYWDSGSYENPSDRGPFYPCHHPGLACDDEEADCSCTRKRVPCEKTCACTKSCPHKFAGCSCSAGKPKKPGDFVCFNDDRCACFQAGRECDPDLCGSCGSCEVVIPASRYDDTVVVGKCRNAVMQRGVPKRTLMGDSGVHGMGLYAGENIQRSDFVGEYKGEIITSEEAERRGTVYDSQNLSYLFTLNAKQLIDSTYYGNKMRFINHRSANANVYARMVMVNTVHRIALYSQRPIKSGEELFFNYGHQFPEEKLGGTKAEKSAPHLRNSRQLDKFYEIEEVEDEVGNIRARKAAGENKARGRPKKGVPAVAGTAKPAPKKKGGARPGAGRPRKAVSEGEGMLDPALPVDAEQAGAAEDVDERDTAERRLANYYVTDERLAEDPEEDVPAEAEDEDEDFDPGEDENDEETYRSDSD